MHLTPITVQSQIQNFLVKIKAQPTIEATKQLATGIFQDIFPILTTPLLYHAIEQLHLPNFYLSITAFVSIGIYFYQPVPIQLLPIVASYGIMDVDCMSRWARIPLDLFLIFHSTLKLGHGIKRRLSHLINVEQKNGHRVRNLVSGMALITFATLKFWFTAKRSIYLWEGSKIAQGYDFEKLDLLKKHEALIHLSKKKSCTAILFDGQFSETEKYSTDDRSSGFVFRDVFKHCDTDIYRIEEDSSRKALNIIQSIEGTYQKKGALDLLIFFGHATSNLMAVNSNVYLTPFSQCTLNKSSSANFSNCFQELDPFLSPTAQVFLYGCYTAYGKDSLTDKIAQLIPRKVDRTVTGMITFISDYDALFQRIRDHFKFWAFFIFDFTKTVPCSGR